MYEVNVYYYDILNIRTMTLKMLLKSPNIFSRHYLQVATLMLGSLKDSDAKPLIVPSMSLMTSEANSIHIWMQCFPQ